MGASAFSIKSIFNGLSQRPLYYYTCPKIGGAEWQESPWPVQIRLVPLQRLEDMPSLSNFQLPPGR